MAASLNLGFGVKQVILLARTDPVIAAHTQGRPSKNLLPNASHCTAVLPCVQLHCELSRVGAPSASRLAIKARRPRVRTSSGRDGRLCKLPVSCITCTYRIVCVCVMVYICV